MGYSGHFENRDSMVAKLYELGLWRSGVRSKDNDRYFDTAPDNVMVYMSVDLDSVPGSRLLNEFFVFEEGAYTLGVDGHGPGEAVVTITDCNGNKRNVLTEIVPVGKDVLKNADCPRRGDTRGNSIVIIDEYKRRVSTIAHIKGTKDTVVFRDLRSRDMTYTSAQLRAIADKMDEVSRYLRGEDDGRVS